MANTGSLRISPVVRLHRHGGTVHAVVERPVIRGYDCRTLTGELAALLDERPLPATVRVDFSGVDQLSAACLLSLIELTGRADTLGCRLQIESLPAAVRKVLRKAGHQRSLHLSRAPSAPRQAWFARRAA